MLKKFSIPISIRLVLAIIVFFMVLAGRTPYFLVYRVQILILACFLLMLLYYPWKAITNKEAPGRGKVKEIIGAVIIIASFLLAAGSWARFSWKRYSVLNAETRVLEKLGSHFIVGYTSVDSVRPLIERKAIAGLFISIRNVKGKSIGSIQKEIAELQALQARNSDLKLFIAADQEGGLVSRLSPPLAAMPPLASCIHADNREKSRKCIKNYAQRQGRDLASLGVTLNLAPVADLKVVYDDSLDFHTKISARAISADPEQVTDAVLFYCKTMHTTGVLTTLKHFPGLGLIRKDTHHFSASVKEDPEQLMNRDWLPFRTVPAQSGSFIMLGHVIVTNLDNDYHTSHSETVVQGLIREKWKLTSPLITDDFCMNPVVNSPGGLEEASVRSLNAGVDVVLVSYHPERYYEAMYGLLQAAEEGRLNWKRIEESTERLKKLRGKHILQ
ncbi:MAG: glycoside hydrolase family 3 protein [bacterium]|nr:glycoside hydrolase family 3 protein [bacterium]